MPQHFIGVVPFAVTKPLVSMPISSGYRLVEHPACPSECEQTADHVGPRALWLPCQSWCRRPPWKRRPGPSSADIHWPPAGGPGPWWNRRTSTHLRCVTVDCRRMTMPGTRAINDTFGPLPCRKALGGSLRMGRIGGSHSHCVQCSRSWPICLHLPLSGG